MAKTKPSASQSLVADIVYAMAQDDWTPEYERLRLLIEAAPDLFQVAQFVLDLLDCQLPRPSVMQMERLEKMAKNAVLKAKGGVE